MCYILSVYFGILPSNHLSPTKTPHVAPLIKTSLPWDFFDAITQDYPSSRVMGGIIHSYVSTSTSFATTLGEASNKFNEFMELKLLIIISKEKGILHINIYGDSMLVIIA
jgi:hypothetical protein